MKTKLTATLLLATGLPLASLFAAGAETFPGVQTLMSAEEFEASGLDKLSPEEIKALNQWLVRYTAGDAQVLVDTVEEIKEVERTQEIFASVEGDFEGWTGNTVIRLDNGQVWKQRRRGNYFHKGDDNRVRITKNFMGFYKLEMVSSGKSVQVERIE